MVEIHEAMDGERMPSLHTLSKHVALLKSPHVHQPGSSLNPIFLSFYGSFITEL